MTPISDLEVFARVVVVGNMSAAGRDMGLSPAVVSKRISQLEKRLGARLIQRTTRRLTLTETGQGFYERIIGVLENIADAEAFVTKDHLQPKGMLRVSAPTAFGRKYIAPRLPEFLERYPDLKINLNLSDKGVDLVGSGIDVAIRITDSEEGASFEMKKLAHNRRVIVASPDYLKAHGTPKNLRELAKHNCLAEEENDVWHLQGPKGMVNFKAKGNLQSNSAEVIREAVLAGAGVGWCSTWDFAEHLKAKELKVILPEFKESEKLNMYAIYASREFVPAKLKVFIDFMEDSIGKKTPHWDKGLKIG